MSGSEARLDHKLQFATLWAQGIWDIQREEKETEECNHLEHQKSSSCKKPSCDHLRLISEGYCSLIYITKLESQTFLVDWPFKSQEVPRFYRPNILPVLSFTPIHPPVDYFLFTLWHTWVSFFFFFNVCGQHFLWILLWACQCLVLTSEEIFWCYVFIYNFHLFIHVGCLFTFEQLKFIICN